MCSQIESEVMESILVADNDTLMRRSRHGDAPGGAQDARLVKAPRRPHGRAGWKGLPQMGLSASLWTLRGRTVGLCPRAA